MGISYLFKKGPFKESIEIRKIVFVMEQGFYDDIDEDDNLCFHFLLLLDNVPIGTARIQPLEDESLKIGRFAILKEYRNKGYGTILMNFIEKESLKNNYKTLKLNSQFDKVDFYKKLGFKIADSKPFKEQDYLHYHMEKRLV